MATPHPQPNNIRALKGDPNKDRYLPEGVKTVKLTERPEPPFFLRGLSLELFNHYCDLLIAWAVMAESDVNSLAVFSWLDAKIQTMMDNDEVPPSSLIAQYKSFLAEFGLTVIAREKMKAPPSEAKKNKYAKKKK